MFLIYFEKPIWALLSPHWAPLSLLEPTLSLFTPFEPSWDKIEPSRAKQTQMKLTEHLTKLKKTWTPKRLGERVGMLRVKTFRPAGRVG